MPSPLVRETDRTGFGSVEEDSVYMRESEPLFKRMTPFRHQGDTALFGSPSRRFCD